MQHDGTVTAKVNLREAAKAGRSKLAEAYRRAGAEQVAALGLGWLGRTAATSVSAFRSFGDELDTGPLLARLAADGYSAQRMQLAWEADVRHEGQATELTVPYPSGDIGRIRSGFLGEYLKTYGYADETPIELMKVRVIGRGLSEHRFAFERMTIAHRRAASSSGARQVSFERGKPAVTTEVVQRHAVPAAGLAGPLLIEEFDGTIAVPPKGRVRRDSLDCLVIDLETAP